MQSQTASIYGLHDDLMTRKHFPCYWPFVRGIHLLQVDVSERPVMHSFGVFFDVDLNMQVQSCQWFETPWHAHDIIPDSKVHGANMGPTWVLSAPDGPHVGPMNLAIRDCNAIFIFLSQADTLFMSSHPVIPNTMVDRAIGDALVRLLITNYQWLSHLNSDHDNHA